MNISKLIELLPDSVKLDTVDFVQVKMKDGKTGTRVLLDRLLTDTPRKSRKAIFMSFEGVLIWLILVKLQLALL